jgi:AcrR family transcriptional regulator
MDEIALTAGTNKNLLYHYFGSKEGLFLSVLERAYADMRERQNEMALIGLPPKQAMEKADRVHLRSLRRDAGVDQPAQQRESAQGAAYRKVGHDSRDVCSTDRHHRSDPA